MLPLPGPRRWSAGWILLGLAGCLDPLADGAAPARDAAVEAATTPDVPNTPCAQDGVGTLRVAVSLAPALAEADADIWLAVHCNDGPAPLRLVRWDGSASQALEHFGPGTYRVLGTSLRTPGHWSTTATLTGFATAAVSLTLGGDGVPLATLSSATAGQLDAGVPDAEGPRDGGVAASLAWHARVPLRDPSGQPLGSCQVVARPLGDGFLEVVAAAQNLCAVPPCAPLPLVGLEARTLEGEAPFGAAIASFERAEVPYGEMVRALPLRLRGRLPDSRNVLQLAVYAAVSPTTRAGARPLRP